MSNFSVWHLLILAAIVALLVAVPVGIYFIARAGARSGARREQGD